MTFCETNWSWVRIFNWCDRKLQPARQQRQSRRQHAAEKILFSYTNDAGAAECNLSDSLTPASSQS
jgi:hypothetical protein